MFTKELYENYGQYEGAMKRIQEIEAAYTSQEFRMKHVMYELFAARRHGYNEAANAYETYLERQGA